MLRNGTQVAGIVMPISGWFPQLPMPTTRLLTEILKDAVRHAEEFPTHGIDCICMDSLIRELKCQVASTLPARTYETMTDTMKWEREFDARRRVAHILRAVERDL